METLVDFERCLDIHGTWHPVTENNVLILALQWGQQGLKSGYIQVSIGVESPEQSLRRHEDGLDTIEKHRMSQTSASQIPLMFLQDTSTPILLLHPA